MIFAEMIGDSPWSKIHDATKKIGFALGFIALGAIGQSVMDQSTKLPWLHQQAAVAYKLKAITLPNLAAAAGCQEKRADIDEGKTGAANTANGLLPCPDVGQTLKQAAK